MKKIKIATRNSMLAKWQAEYVKEQLKENHSDIEIELLYIKTEGDRFLDSPLFNIGGKGLFIKELEEALLSKDADIAIHSMKDVPAKLDSRFSVSTIMKREDPRDVFISEKYKRLADIESGVIGSSSPRRQAMVKNKYCKIQTFSRFSF